MSVELVAIGASAGGFDAVSTLLGALEPGFAAAVVIVLHLSPEHPSLAARLFGERCRLLVREAEDKQRIDPGHVYVAPPNYHLLIERSRTFALSVDASVHHSRPAIDALFETAAWAYGKNALGVVLTGANEDGASGLACIKSHGGTTWVQSPETALASFMPRAAIERSRPDAVLTLAEMATRLGRLTPSMERSS